MATEKPEILSDLETFLQEIEYYRYSRLPIVAEGLPRRQVAYIGNLRNKLLRDLGKYRLLITELIGIEEPQISQRGNLHSSDLWLKGLELEFDYTAAQALDFCIDIINVAIGKLEDDIEKGLRDKQGNPIEKPSDTEPLKVFVSHGKESIALQKLENFLDALGVEPLIVRKQPSRDKTVDGKVDYYLDQADFVIILATGDDEFEGKLHPRQNVIHEIGLAQKTLPGKIIYLLEGNTEFPSNIKTKVWETFSQENMENVFTQITIEFKEFGILKAIKPQKGASS